LTLLSHVIDDHELNGSFHEYYIDNEIYEFPKRSKIREIRNEFALAWRSKIRVIREIRGLKSFCVFENINN